MTLMITVLASVVLALGGALSRSSPSRRGSRSSRSGCVRRRCWALPGCARCRSWSSPCAITTSRATTFPRRRRTPPATPSAAAAGHTLLWRRSSVWRPAMPCRASTRAARPPARGDGPARRRGVRSDCRRGGAGGLEPGAIRADLARLAVAGQHAQRGLRHAGRLTQLGSSRPLYWHQALDVGSHAVLKGVGELGFGIARLRYTTSTLKTDQAHNYVVQTFADLGIIGVALTLALLVAWCRAAARPLAVGARWRALDRPGDGRARGSGRDGGRGAGVRNPVVPGLHLLLSGRDDPRPAVRGMAGRARTAGGAGRPPGGHRCVGAAATRSGGARHGTGGTRAGRGLGDVAAAALGPRHGRRREPPRDRVRQRPGSGAAATPCPSSRSTCSLSSISTPTSHGRRGRSSYRPRICNRRTPRPGCGWRNWTS